MQPSSSRREETTGILRILAAATIWGTIPLLVRVAEASPLVIVFWRVTLSALTLLAVLAIRGRMSAMLALSRRSVLALAGMGALLALNWVLFFTGISLTHVAVAELLAYTGPVLVAALTPIMSSEAFDRRIALPLALALGGMALIVGPVRLTMEGRQSLGALAALASALTYAILVINAKRLLEGIDTDVYIFVESVAASAILLPAVLLLPGPSAHVQWLAVIALGVVNTALTGLLFLSGLRRVRADRAAALTYAEPVSAIAFAALLLGEPLALRTLAGGALIVGAGLVVARMAPSPAPEELPIG